MRVNVPTRLSADDLQGKWEDDRETLIGALGEFQEGTTNAINGNLSSDNTTSTYREYTLKHGVETRIRNPLKVPVRGIYAVKCVGLEMSGGRPTRKFYTLGVSRIDWETADTDANVLLVTANYELNHTLPFLAKRASAVQSVPDNTETAMSGLDVEVGSRGSIITESSGVFTVSEAGTYDISVKNRWEDAAYTASVLTQIRHDQSGAKIGDFRSGAASTVGPYHTVSVVIKAAAGDSFTARLTQVNGVAAARNALSGVNGRQMAVHRLYNDTIPTGKVTLFFFGG